MPAGTTVFYWLYWLSYLICDMEHPHVVWIRTKTAADAYSLSLTHSLHIT